MADLVLSSGCTYTRLYAHTNIRDWTSVYNSYTPEAKEASESYHHIKRKQKQIAKQIVHTPKTGWALKGGAVLFHSEVNNRADGIIGLFKSIKG